MPIILIFIFSVAFKDLSFFFYELKKIELFTCKEDIGCKPFTQASFQ
ncbi:MAG: hypothetical protein MUO91_05540 [candidate division Zixibacteria bacterium]|nr:hypothetical protein [candidate division Zixibacteria bacterium]